MKPESYRVFFLVHWRGTVKVEGVVIARRLFAFRLTAPTCSSDLRPYWLEQVILYNRGTNGLHSRCDCIWLILLVLHTSRFLCNASTVDRRRERIWAHIISSIKSDQLSMKYYGVVDLDWGHLSFILFYCRSLNLFTLFCTHCQF